MDTQGQITHSFSLSFFFLVFVLYLCNHTHIPSFHLIYIYILGFTFPFFSFLFLFLIYWRGPPTSTREGHHSINLHLTLMWRGARPYQLSHCRLQVSLSVMSWSTYPNHALSLLWTFSICNNFISSTSRIQWYHTSICFDYEWKV